MAEEASFKPISKEDRERLEAEIKKWLEAKIAEKVLKENTDDSYDALGGIDMRESPSNINITKVRGSYICNERSLPNPLYGPKEIYGTFIYHGNSSDISTLKERVDRVRKFCYIYGRINLCVDDGCTLTDLGFQDHE